MRAAKLWLSMAERSAAFNVRCATRRSKPGIPSGYLLISSLQALFVSWATNSIARQISSHGRLKGRPSPTLDTSNPFVGRSATTAQSPERNHLVAPVDSSNGVPGREVRVVARLGKMLLLAGVIFALGLVALSVADGAERWVGPTIIAAIVALVVFGLRYVFVSSKR